MWHRFIPKPVRKLPDCRAVNIVVAFDGVTVQNQEELTKQMQYYKAGESVEITIMVNSANGYQQKNVTVTLSSYDQINAASKAAQESKQR